MPRSVHNKILRVNLTEGSIRVDPMGDVYLRRYMGGWNIIADTLLREVPAKADALGPENKLIFAPGVLTGLALAGASRHAVGAKSPLTGGFGAAEVGGNWGAVLKHAGYDAIIIEGVSPQPVYLWVQDGEAQIRPASHLWGKPIKETEETIRKELGDEHIPCCMIGPGGENLVRYACIMSGLRDAAGRTGLGAVMGSKKLKAIAVRSANRLDGADSETIRSMAREMAKAVTDGKAAAGLHQWGTGRSLETSLLTGNLPIHNFRDGEFPNVAGISAENFMPRIGIGMDGCYACAVRCKKVVRAETPYSLDSAYGGPELESVGCLGSSCGVDDIVAIAKATELCNANSLDSITTGDVIAMAMECFEHGLLTPADTDGIDLRFGNADAVIQMVEKIARREGLGNLLAEGPLRAAQQIGGGAERFAVQVKNQGYPVHEPRLQRGLAISYAVSPTGADHQHALHDSGLINPAPSGFLANDGLRGMGVLETMALPSLGAEKVRAAVYQMMSQVLNNCLVLCNFLPWTLQQKATLVQAATGWDVGAYELLKAGERALTLARVFNMREGLTAADDRLPERSYGPTTSGPLANAGISRDDLDRAVHMYYEMMGWDGETGVPLPGKLNELDVAWAAEYLPR